MVVLQYGSILRELKPLQARLEARPTTLPYAAQAFTGDAPAERDEFIRRGIRQLGLFYLYILRQTSWNAAADAWEMKWEGAPTMAAVSLVVDEFWHAHVLSTRDYRLFWEGFGRAKAADAKPLFVDHFLLEKEYAALTLESRKALYSYYVQTTSALRKLAKEIADAPRVPALDPQVYKDLDEDRAPELDGDTLPNPPAAGERPAFSFWPGGRFGAALPLTCTNLSLNNAQQLR